MFGTGHLCRREMANPQGAPPPDSCRSLALTGLDQAAISSQGDTTDRHTRLMHYGVGVCVALREGQGMFKASRRACVAWLTDPLANPHARQRHPLPLHPPAHSSGRRSSTWLVTPPAKASLQCLSPQGAVPSADSPLDRERGRRLARRALERHRKPCGCAA